MNRIAQLRKQAGLLQEELASVLKVHQSAVSQWETDRTRPDTEILQAIADHFQVSVDYVLGRTEERMPKPVRAVVNRVMEAVEDLSDAEIQEVIRYVSYLKFQHKQ